MSIMHRACLVWIATAFLCCLQSTDAQPKDANTQEDKAMPPPVGKTTPLYDTNNKLPFTPDFKPEPTLALPTHTFKVGQLITVGGPTITNFYPNLLMDVYVVPHRIWMEGDSLTDNLVHRSLVKSDETGTIPRTELWRADRPGKFDLIVDYDNDGKFSWKLDALGGFIVEDPKAQEFTIALDNRYMSRHSRPLVIIGNGVLDNDYHRPAATLQARKLTDPRHGALNLHTDGTFRYTPKPGFVGFDQFTYEAVASSGKADSASVLLHITNVAPEAKEDQYAMSPGGTLIVRTPGVLANDCDKDGDRLTAILRSKVYNGKIDFRADGSFTYTPKPGFEGKDSFTYVAHDGVAKDSIAVVEIVVQMKAAALAEPTPSICHERRRRGLLGWFLRR